jgi:hypothetical protein
MPDASKILATISKQADRALMAPSTGPDQQLVTRMGAIVKHAMVESDLVFPDDCDIEDAFNIVVTAFMDALSAKGDLVEAYKSIFPRLSGRRARTPAKEAARLLELSRASHRSVGDYNREVFARAGVTPMLLAETLKKLIVDGATTAAEKMAALKLIIKMCQFDEPEKATGLQQPIVAIQNVLPAGRRGNFDAQYTEEGKQQRDAIFTQGGGLANATAPPVIEAETE